MTLKGLVTGKAIKPRPGMKERIERERALGGGWRGAQDVLTSAPADEAAEVTETLGRLPYETLCYGMDADAAAAHQAASTPMKAAIVTAIKQGEDGPGATYEAGGRPGKPVVVKLPHARERHDDCEIPNGEARTQVTLPGHAHECVLASFDQLGRRLAAVCREGSMYTVQIFDMATGQCTAAFAGHGSSVYDVCWAPNPEVDVGASLGTVDFGGGAPTRVITASADGAARAWSVGADARAPPGAARVRRRRRAARVRVLRRHVAPATTGARGDGGEGRRGSAVEHAVGFGFARGAGAGLSSHRDRAR